MDIAGVELLPRPCLLVDRRQNKKEFVASARDMVVPSGCGITGDRSPRPVIPKMFLSFGILLPSARGRWVMSMHEKPLADHVQARPEERRCQCSAVLRPTRIIGWF